MKQNLINSILLIIIGLVLGMIIHNKFKKCNETQITKIDSVYVSIPDTSKYVSVPIIKYIETKSKSSKPQIIIVHDTINNKIDTIYNSYIEYQDFIAIDTFKVDSLGISVKSFGNCEGIYKNEYNWFGKQKTIINNIVKTPQNNNFEMSLGASTEFHNAKHIKNMKLVNFAPGLLVSYKKIIIGYEYDIIDNNSRFKLYYKLYRK